MSTQTASPPGFFENMSAEIGRLCDEKQAAYGDSYSTTGPALRLLYPDGLRPEQFEDALCVARIWDKLCRVATARDALGESPYRDIAGYALLGLRNAERRRQVEQAEGWGKAGGEQ